MISVVMCRTGSQPREVLRRIGLVMDQLGWRPPPANTLLVDFRRAKEESFVFPRMRDLRGEAYPAEPSLAFPAAVAESEDHEGIPGSDTKVSQPAAGREGCEADHRGTESRAWRLGNPLRTGKAGWEFKRPDTFVRKRLRR
jgi:hypothetical protein